MKNQNKSATCCYCGSHTLLTLGGKTRHELKCSNCGAPIGSMKSIRRDHVEDPFTVRGKRGKKPSHTSKYGKRPERKRAKKKKSFAQRVFDIAEDVLEEAFDIFD